MKTNLDSFGLAEIKDWVFDLSSTSPMQEIPTVEEVKGFEKKLASCDTFK